MAWYIWVDGWAYTCTPRVRTCTYVRFKSPNNLLACRHLLYVGWSDEYVSKAQQGILISLHALRIFLDVVDQHDLLALFWVDVSMKGRPMVIVAEALMTWMPLSEYLMAWVWLRIDNTWMSLFGCLQVKPHREGMMPLWRGDESIVRVKRCFYHVTKIYEVRDVAWNVWILIKK